MGKGAFMFVYNLDTNNQLVNGVTSSNCMYDNGVDGSNISLWNNQTIPPKTAVPAYGWKAPQYIEADGSWSFPCGCACEQSTFTLGFNNGASVTLNLQSALIAVTESSQGNVVCSVNSNSSLNIWSGQAGIGIMILPDPSTIPAQSGYLRDPSNWMGELNASSNGAFFNQPLNMVSFPASHDSGMSVASQCTTLAGAAQTQTQTLDIGGQLGAGIRYFDLRPCVWDINGNNGPNDFAFGHFSPTQSGQGCLGQNMVQALQQVLGFVNSHENEIVLLKFSHFTDSSYNAFTIALQQQMINAIQGVLGSMMYTASAGEKINSNKLESIIQSARRVICIFDGLDASLYSPAAGILKFGDLSGIPAGDANLDIYDNYSDSDNLSVMVADQIDKYFKFLGGTGNNVERNGMFLLSFTLTQSTTDAILAAAGLGTVLGLANYANAYLWTVITSLLKGPTTQQPPNLVYIDSVNNTNALSAAIYLNYQNSSLGL